MRWTHGGGPAAADSSSIEHAEAVLEPFSVCMFSFLSVCYAVLSLGRARLRRMFFLLDSDLPRDIGFSVGVVLLGRKVLLLAGPRARHGGYPPVQQMDRFTTQWPLCTYGSSFVGASGAERFCATFCIEKGGSVPVRV